MQDYITILEEYFLLIENCQQYSKYVFLNECGRLLPLIYSKTLSLPALEVTTSEIQIDESKIHRPIEDIINLLGNNDIYYEIFDPLVDEQNVTGSIADDLADIYRDLKLGYLKYSIGTEEGVQDAIWEWKFSLQTHFGDHLVDVMRPIQRLIMSHLSQNE